MSAGEMSEYLLDYNGILVSVGNSVIDIQDQLKNYMHNVLMKAIRERDGAIIAVSGKFFFFVFIFSCNRIVLFVAQELCMSSP